MSEEKSFFEKLADLIGGTSTKKQIPDSSDFLTKYESVENKVIVNRGKPLPNVKKEVVTDVASVEKENQVTEDIPPAKKDINEELSAKQETVDTQNISPQADQEISPKPEITFSQTFQNEVVAPVNERVNFCPACGAKNISDYKFCTNCGTPNPLLNPDAHNTVSSVANNSGNNREEAKKQEKSLGRKALIVIRDVFIFLILAGVLGAAGYWAYLKYLTDDSYKLAQRFINKRDWAIADRYLGDAILDAQTGKLSSTPTHSLSESDQEKLVLWKSGMEKIMTAITLANTKNAISGNASVPDYLNILSEYRDIPIALLKDNSFGEVNTSASLRPLEMTFDSIKLNYIKKILESKKIQRSDDGSLIYVDQGTRLSVDTLFSAISYPDDPAISSGLSILKGMKSGIVNMLSSDSSTQSSSIATTATPVADPVQSGIKSVETTTKTFQVTSKPSLISAPAPTSNVPTSFEVKSFLVGKVLCSVKCIDIDKIGSLYFDKPRAGASNMTTVTIHFIILDEAGERNPCDGDLTYIKRGTSYQLITFASI